MKDRYLLKCVAITYEEPDELLKVRHRDGVHKYKTYFQAIMIIYQFSLESTN
jgi:hypothetical protein